MFEEEEEGEAAAGSSEEADDLRADEPWAAPAASSTATPTASDIYDVYVSYSRADLAWAERLVRELSDRGLRCFFDLDMSAGDSWTETLNRALDNSRTLVVLWSAAAADAKGIRSELADFEVLMRRQDQPRRMLPIMLGSADLLRSAPNALRSRQALIIGPEAYAAGPEADSEEWTQAVEAISNAARASPRFDPTRRRTKQAPQPAASRPGSFSASARAALTYAAAMLGDLGDDEPARVRTAALLGALYAAAMSGMTPTTGDVLRLVLSRQPHGRTADETLAAAGIAAGLKRLPEARAAVMTLDELMRSPVAALVREAAEMQVRTASARVHLRHVLATGVHPSVSPQALAELRITMAELRAEWRASIARTWPAESAEGWDSILLERRAGATFGQAPPSASVHRDRWTIDDGLDYALYAKAISEFIGHKDAKPPLVISVQAPWGQGKTSLMRMVQSNLDPDHPDLRDLGSNKRKTDLVEPPSQLTFRDLRDSLDGDVTIDHSEQEEIRTVWFNAWKYQSSEQIWAGLAHAILSQLPARLSARNREFFWLRLQLRRIDPSVVRGDIHRAALERFLPRLAGWAVLALGAIIVAGLSLLAGGLGAAGTGLAGAGALGIAAVARRAWAKATTDVLERRLEGAYLRYVRQPDYASKLGYLHLVEEDMGRALDLLTPDDKPTVIFIDDLDRCSPAKIGEVVEAVNLFLAGDYPNCAFVIGIDAEVVAASMEVVHAEIIEKLADRRGELGWRFMDKFVQLPFVMPRLHVEQREAYLRSLFATPRDGEARELVAAAAQLKSDAKRESLPAEEFARRAGELAPRLAAVAPQEARALGEEVVSAGAKAFSDDDPEVIQALADQLQYLSDNPRTIKRAVNLYRFHRFAAFARQASSLHLEVATPEQTGRWIVVIIRWPQFVRWLQAQREATAAMSQDPAARVLAMAHASESLEAFREALHDEQIDAAWINELELLEFLRADVDPELDLGLAGARGLW